MRIAIIALITKTTTAALLLFLMVFLFKLFGESEKRSHTVHRASIINRF
jgi:hypothetical protein